VTAMGDEVEVGFDEDEVEVEPRIEFSDDEWAFLRYARFGELPHRVLPEERVELVETEPGGGYVDPNQRNWRDLSTGGA
jgi:hypothetical protein